MLTGYTKRVSLLSIQQKLFSQVTKNGMATEELVIFESTNKKGIITLNREKKLNSLNLEMVKKIKENLLKWKDNQMLVIVRGKGRAFCSGADVVSLAKGGTKMSNSGREFFHTEYGMNGLIGEYPVPYIAIIDGITMGGGVGLAVHGKIRIATEKTLFAMPETAIGLFPDVGMSYVLGNQPNKLGNFLGLTGYRLQGADVVKAGIATHYIESKNIESLFKELVDLKNSNDLNPLLKQKTADMSKHKFSLDPHLKTIENCFVEKNVEEIVKKLEKDGSPFAKQTLETMKQMSPLSLKFTTKLIEDAKSKNLRDCLIVEYRLAAAITEARISSDFYEGVRAQLIDKDKKPKWNPPTLEKVTNDMVNSGFKQLPPDQELKF